MLFGSQHLLDRLGCIDSWHERVAVALDVRLQQVCDGHAEIRSGAVDEHVEQVLRKLPETVGLVQLDYAVALRGSNVRDLEDKVSVYHWYTLRLQIYNLYSSY